MTPDAGARPYRRVCRPRDPGTEAGCGRRRRGAGGSTWRGGCREASCSTVCALLAVHSPIAGCPARPVCHGSKRLPGLRTDGGSEPSGCRVVIALGVWRIAHKRSFQRLVCGPLRCCGGACGCMSVAGAARWCCAGWGSATACARASRGSGGSSPTGGVTVHMLGFRGRLRHQVPRLLHDARTVAQRPRPGGRRPRPARARRARGRHHARPGGLGVHRVGGT